MKIISSILLILNLMFISAQSNDKKIANQTYTKTLKVNNQTLTFNGGGIREKYGFIDLYTCGLYLKSTTKDASKVIHNDEEMALRIVIVSSLVTNELFIEALEEGLKNSTSGKYTQTDISDFKKCLTEDFKIGDEVILKYIPNKGVSIFKNGEERGNIGALSFKKALFAIWLGGNPADDSLKDDLLGL